MSKHPAFVCEARVMRCVTVAATADLTPPGLADLITTAHAYAEVWDPDHPSVLLTASQISADGLPVKQVSCYFPPSQFVYLHADAANILAEKAHRDFRHHGLPLQEALNAGDTMTPAEDQLDLLESDDGQDT